MDMEKMVINLKKIGKKMILCYNKSNLSKVISFFAGLEVLLANVFYNSSGIKM